MANPGGEQRPLWQGQHCCEVLLCGTEQVAVVVDARFLASCRGLVKLKKLYTCILCLCVLSLVGRQCELLLLKELGVRIQEVSLKGCEIFSQETGNKKTPTSEKLFFILNILLSRVFLPNCQFLF